METEAAEEVLCPECGGKHAGPCGIEKVLAALSVNLTQGFKGTTRWSISDTTAGLLKLYKRHAFEGAEDSIIGDEVQNRATLEEIQEWLRWATAAYDKDRAALLTSMLEQQLQYQDIVQQVATSAINQPAHFIAVYHARQCVVMGIRGTYNTTDILTDLNPHTEPFQDGSAHTGILGAAKWLLEKEGPTLKALFHDNPGYKLVLTGHSLGAAVAALMAMMLHASATSAASKMERILPMSVASKMERFFPTTTIGIPPSEIVCWGYGCAPCVDRTIAEETAFIHNVVLQDDVVPRVNPAAIETLRDEIQETSLSQVFKDGKKKKMIETIERVHVARAFKSGYHKIQNVRMLHRRTPQSSSNSESIKSIEASPSEDTSISDSNMDDNNMDDINMDDNNMDDPEKEASIAAQAIVAVAEGPTVSKEELESRRLFVPGNLYHIRRRPIPLEEQPLGPPVPLKPFEEGKDAPRNSKYKHHVIQGTTTTSRFGRIILSSTMLSDHGCFNIRDGLLDAMEQLDRGMMQQPPWNWPNPHVLVE